MYIIVYYKLMIVTNSLGKAETSMVIGSGLLVLILVIVLLVIVF
jgi:hypothetical protein